MKILVLNPQHHRIAYSVFHSLQENPIASGMVPLRQEELREAGSAVAFLWSHLEAKGVAIDFDAIGIRIAHGGEQFMGPVLADDSIISQLREITASAPLHIPPAITLIKALRREFEPIPIVLVFESSFFTRLPERERVYALPPEFYSPETTAPLRGGFHGIYHESACSWAVSQLKRARRLLVPYRIVSICLDSHPELAAVRGINPLTVTGGITPLEGLPGQTTCGELDPGIILQLARDQKLGPEEMDDILTRQSGLRGLTGTSATLATVFNSHDSRYQLAREVMLQRILLATGAAIAALGGVDAFVFSGQFSSLGKTIGDWLLFRMPFLRGTSGTPSMLAYPTRLDLCIAHSVAVRVRNSMLTFA